jgi:hypothetical protein
MTRYAAIAGQSEVQELQEQIVLHTSAINGWMDAILERLVLSDQRGQRRDGDVGSMASATLVQSKCRFYIGDCASLNSNVDCKNRLSMGGALR